MDAITTPDTLAAGLARLAAAIDEAAINDAGVGGERTLVEQQLLLVLHQRGPALSLADLARQVGMSRTDTLAAVNLLATKELVRVAPAPSYSPHEARIELTERGSRHPTLLNWAGALLAELDRLDDAERRDLLQLVVSRIAALQREDRIPVTRMCLTCRFFEPYAHVGDPAPHHCALVGAPFGTAELRLRCPEQQPPV